MNMHKPERAIKMPAKTCARTYFGGSMSKREAAIGAPTNEPTDESKLATDSLILTSLSSSVIFVTIIGIADNKEPDKNPYNTTITTKLPCCRTAIHTNATSAAENVRGTYNPNAPILFVRKIDSSRPSIPPVFNKDVVKGKMASLNLWCFPNDGRK